MWRRQSEASVENINQGEMGVGSTSAGALSCLDECCCEGGVFVL